MQTETRTLTDGTCIPPAVLASVAIHSDDPVVIVAGEAPALRVAYVNAAFERLAGRPAEAVVGRAPTFLADARIDAPTRERVRHALTHGESLRVDLAGGRPDGATFWVDASLIPVKSDGAGHWVVVLREITQRRNRETALERQALHDQLTGLPNRVLFHARLEFALRQALEDGRPLTLLLFDLDNFKEINDTFGHEYGDRLLTEVATRVRAVLRESDTLARVGGDEFAALLPGTDGAGAEVIARRVIDAMTGPVRLQGTHLLRHLPVGVSVGAAIFPEHGDDARSLLRLADIAMYSAKRRQAGFSVFAPEQDQHSKTGLSLAGELQSAARTNQFRLHFQPLIDLNTGRFVRAEALVRWQHPEHGLIRPDQFVPQAERNGVIRALTAWVIDETLGQIRAWQGRGISVPVAVNLSMRDLHDAALAELVQDAITRHGVDPSLFQIELTESAVMTDPERALSALEALRTMGVGVAIDDFGTGFTSLAYLTTLPLNGLKIDRAFVQGMDESRERAAVVRSTIELGHALGLKVTAEGVDRPALLDQLRAFRCDTAQGYLISRPLAPDAFAAWLRQPGRTTVAPPPAASRLKLPTRLPPVRRVGG